MYYTYVYLDPRKCGRFVYNDICFLYEPFYVGKGQNARYRYHLTTSRFDNPIFKNKINKITSLGIEPFIEILKFTEHENISYFNEKDMIIQIGSKLINEIKDGPLLNICLDNQPPKLKGKTYKEIYGDRWKEQIEIRRKSIKENHRLYKRSHTEETKRKISESTSKEKNPRWGVKLSDDIKNKIGNKARDRMAIKNHFWKRWLVISPLMEEFIIDKGLKEFCVEKNISYSTLRKCLKTKTSVKSGRTCGWMIKEIT